MTRAPLVLFLAVLLAAPPAAGAARLAPRSAQLHGLAAGPGGNALAVVDSGLSAAPFRLVRSSGRGRRDVGVFGDSRAEFPDVGADRRRAVVSWSRPVSGGSEVLLAHMLEGRLGRSRPAAHATGPARLAVQGAAAVLTYPDQVGDVVLFPPVPLEPYGAPVTRRLTSDAPATRHHPLDVAVGGAGPLVLDLAQRRRRSSLLVLGRGAPRTPVVTVPALRHLEGAIDAAGDLVAVAYFSRGRAVLATSGRDGRWKRRRLPGRGGGVDAPVPVIAGRRVHVAYVQEVRGRREILVASVPAGRGRIRSRRLTRSASDDRGPRAAPAPRGGVYVGWTSRAPGSSQLVPRLRRLAR